MFPSLEPEVVLIEEQSSSSLSSPLPSVNEDSPVNLPSQSKADVSKVGTDPDVMKSSIRNDLSTLVTKHLRSSLPLTDVINAIRVLAADAVENASSGHPGMPMGMAPAACVLWDKHLRFNPNNPAWINRDRFILSAGHGSMLQYALMYLYGYDSMTLDDILNFRKPGSRATGHPENVVTPGVEVTTGALGQGLCNAVGMAMAEAHLSAVYNRDDTPALIDHFTYCIVGDGCLMEGIASEACSLAGHWRLGKLIVIYDDNSVSIDGSTDIAFTEDVLKRFSAYGWHCVQVQNGDCDLEALDAAVVEAKSVVDMPSLIKVTTTIGYGAPKKSGTSGAHGSCLGRAEIDGVRDYLGWRYAPFKIPDRVLRHTRRRRCSGKEMEQNWSLGFDHYRTLYPDMAAQFEKLVLRQELPGNWTSALHLFLNGNAGGKPTSTRAISYQVLNALASHLPNMMGGSADLGSSNLTNLEKNAGFQHFMRNGRTIHFGVREHGMAAITNGLALYNGGLIPFCATFLVFSDYCRAAIRTAALSNAGVIYIFTHDSVLLGEDGPTHQPVEHLASFRAMPGVFTFRPADSVEVAACYELAVERRSSPSLMVLSRQKFVCPPGSACGTRRGGYIHSVNKDKMASDGDPDLVYIATGSEVALASSAAEKLRLEGVNVSVVSMPCVELFEQQSKSYRRSVLPKSVPMNRRVIVEAGCQFGWHKYGTQFHTVDKFGISGNEDAVRQKFAMTVEAVLRRSRSVLADDSEDTDSD